MFSKHGVHWPIRETGHSEKRHGERLYALLMKMQGGIGAELALKHFSNRADRPAEDIQYLLEVDLRHFGFL